MEIGAFEAKNTLGSLLGRVEQGEKIVITRLGKPVARLIPSSGGINPEQARAAASRIRSSATQLKADRFVWQGLKVERDEGRP